MKRDVSLEEKVHDTVKTYGMLEKGDRVVIGVSGGPDSMCLLHALLSLKDRLGVDIYAVHVNHMLRGEEADRDEAHVVKWCKEHGVPVCVERTDVRALAEEKKISIEEAGREARYSAFRKALQNMGANKIAVAHNMNDSAETVLMRLIRGTGIDGLTGIEPVRGNIIRPLIESRREEIEKYCTDNGIPVVTDSSNTETGYTRNKVRILLLDRIKAELNPDIIPVIARTASLLKEDVDLLYGLSKAAFKDCRKRGADKAGERAAEVYGSVTLDLKKFNELHISLKRRVMRLSVGEVKGNLTHIESRHINDAVEFAAMGRTGSYISLPGNMKVIKSYDSLTIAVMGNRVYDECAFERQLSVPGTTYVPELDATVTAEVRERADSERTAKDCDAECLREDRYTGYFDMDKLDMPLYVRNRRYGDVFRPSGMKGRKKLKEYMIDEKIPRQERPLVPLIASGKEVVWVIGRRVSEKFRRTADTRRELIIRFIKKDR